LGAATGCCFQVSRCLARYFQAVRQFPQLGIGLNLNAEMVNTIRARPSRRYSEVHFGIVQHPFCVVRLYDGRKCGEQRRIEADGFFEIIDRDVNVQALHSSFPVWNHSKTTRYQPTARTSRRHHCSNPSSGKPASPASFQN
jgi:hypothetical protein